MIRTLQHSLCLFQLSHLFSSKWKKALKLSFIPLVLLSCIQYFGQSPNDFDCFVEQVSGQNQSQMSGCMGYHNYIPDEYTIPKLVRVNFHFMCYTEDEPRNFTATDDGLGNTDYTGYDVANEILNTANWFQWYVVNEGHQMNLPPGNTTEVIPWNFQYELNGVFFHYSEEDYDSASPYGLSSEYGEDLGNAVNAFLVYCESCSGGGAANQSGNRAFFLSRIWQKYVEFGDDFHIPSAGSGIFQHEICHNFGLDHTMQAPWGPCWDQDDGIDDTPTRPEMIALGEPDPCCSTGQSDPHCTNNLMDYASGRVLTPQQLGLINESLVNSMRGYLANDFCALNEIPPYVIDGEVLVWNDKRLFDRDIILRNNASLTVHCDVEMGFDKRITVEAGSQLTIDGGMISSACEETRTWSGIYIQGDPDGQSAGNPGRVQVFNGGVIEHASSALNNFIHVGEDCQVDWSTIGGVIQTHDGAILRDNKRDVQFLKYSNINNGQLFDDQSFFANTSFLTTDEFPFDGMVQNVTMWKVRGVAFRSCNFADERTGIADGLKRNGLFTINAGYRIGKNCPNSDPDCTGQDYSSFTGMGTAIESTGKGLITIARTDFDSHRGILMRNVPNATIVKNSFQVDTYPESQGDQDRPFGLFMQECRNYQVEDNSLVSDVYSGQQGIPVGAGVGVVINNDDDNIERIYNNDFDGFAVATEAIGQNRIASTFINSGLQIRCNDFSSNYTDIYVRGATGLDPLERGIARYQGSPDGTNSDLAGNRFSSLSASPLIGKNYVNPSLLTDPAINVNPISYFMHDPDATGSDLRVEPSYSSNVSGISLFTSEFEYNDEACLSQVGQYLIAGVGLAKKMEAQDSIQAKMDLLLLVVDDGDTEGLQSQVAMTSDADAWAKYLSLMEKAGYLSEEVLQEVASKEEGFTVAMIRDILYANPHAAKSREVDEKLEERTDPLPEYMIQQIKTGLHKLSAKEYIELLRDDHRYERDMVIKHTLRGLLLDSDVDHSASIMLLLSNTGDIDFDYDLVEYYDGHGEEDLADGLLAVMQGYSLEDAEIEELQAYLDLRALVTEWESQGKDMTALDPADMALLGSYADRMDRSSAEAKALMMLNRHKEAVSAYIPSSAEKRLSFLRASSTTDKDSKMELFPNPAEEYFTLSYKTIPLEGEVLRLEIYAADGKVVQQRSLSYAQDQILIKTDGMKAGLYQVIILSDDRTIAVEPLTIR